MRSTRLLLALLVAAVSAVMAAPLFWMLLCSVRSDAEILAAPFGWPSEWRWQQWGRAWQEGNLARYGWNSLGITGLTVGTTVLLSAAAAYSAARTGSRLPLLFLPGLILPAQAGVVPTFLLLRSMRLLDTWWALVFPYTAWGLPLGFFVFYGFFRSQSREAEEAARLDGCGPAALFWRIALPLARPAAGVVALVTALGTWNEFLFALLFTSTEAARTLPLGLLAFSSAHTTDYGLTFAALALMSLPLLGLYALVQRRLIEGAAAVVEA